MLKKGLVIGIIVMFLLSSCTILSAIGIITNKTIISKDFDIPDIKNSGNVWVRTFGGIYYDFSYDCQQTNDGGYIIVGSTQFFGDNGHDLWLIKTNTDGIEEWNITYGGESGDSGKSVQQTNDGGYIIAGWKDSRYAWIIKTDENGNIIWDKKYDDRSTNSIIQTYDEGFIAAGSQKNPDGNRDINLLKIDRDGNEMWSNTFINSGSGRTLSIQETFDNGFIIMGNKSIIKTDEYGVEEWIIKLASDMVGSDALQSNDGSYTAIGGKMDWPSIGWMMRINVDGKIVSWKNYSGLFSKYGPTSLYQTKDDGYIITGVYQFETPFTNRISKLWLAKTDELGNIQWEKRFGKPDELDIGMAVQQTIDEGYIVVGGTNSYGAGGVDILLIKTDSEGKTKQLTSENHSDLFLRFLEQFPLLNLLLQRLSFSL